MQDPKPYGFAFSPIYPATQYTGATCKLFAKVLKDRNSLILASVVYKEEPRRGGAFEEVAVGLDVEALGFVIAGDDQTNANDVLIMQGGFSDFASGSGGL